MSTPAGPDWVDDIASAVVDALGGRPGPRVETCPHRIAARQAYERSSWALAIRDSREARLGSAAEFGCAVEVLAAGGSVDKLLACRRD